MLERKIKQLAGYFLAGFAFVTLCAILIGIYVVAEGVCGTPFARLITLFLILAVVGVLLSSGVVNW